MISISGYAAEFLCGNRWLPCDTVGVCGEPHDLKFVVIVHGPTEYVAVVSEVRRRSNTPAEWV